MPAAALLLAEGGGGVIQTASFFTPGLSWRDRRVVSIARTRPAGFRGRSAEWLFPSAELLDAYRRGQVHPAEYRRRYLAQLEDVPAAEIVQRLGADAILVCWERAGSFCHRRVLAEKIEKELGILVPELRPAPVREYA